MFSSSPPVGLVQLSGRGAGNFDGFQGVGASSSSTKSVRGGRSFIVRQKRVILFSVSVICGLLVSFSLLYWFVLNLIVLFYCWVVDSATRDVFKHLLNVFKKPLSSESLGVIIVLLLQQVICHWNNFFVCNFGSKGSSPKAIVCRFLGFF